MSSPNTSHLLLMASPGWSHTRPLCVLAARLVSERQDLVVTIFTTPQVLEKARFEIARQSESGSSSVQRIRLVSIFQFSVANLMEDFRLFAEAYPAAYQTLAQGKPITCSTTGVSFEAAPAPVAVIFDFFLLPQLQMTRAVTGRSVPIITWFSGGCTTFLRDWGSESVGGRGDFSAKVDEEVARTGKSPLEVGEELYYHLDGSVIRVPGLPAMYDHEFFPQKLPFEVAVSVLIRNGAEFVKDSDALMMTSSDAYEKSSLDAIRTWFAELQKPVYAIGPLLPAGYTSTQSDVDESNADVKVFLDGALEKYGARSVFFISFGSIFWPSHKPEYLEEVVEACVEKQLPFVLSHASPIANIPEGLLERAQTSGLGLLTPWSPQQFILNHPATGWFITHTGHGSVMESLSSGIPMICWPFQGDQPTAAAHLTENLEVAFELTEVRTANGLKPIHRLNGRTPKGTREAVGVEIRSVFDRCRGKEGEELRENAERLKRELGAAWEDGGAAKVAFREFLERYAK
ncbi:putative UDP-glucoronosyl and UDP-glucosyl transferase [Lyophyllum shimeji]|uniref:UDP-glucoronosyl and UDP-glucosyl transferase n=1 Tax=Lyophyllum shimeji TaxID=47721 RepID=A0A9P3UQA9_LYOSH|nr:putative UDP-glucoronosyl and UDP-glucosyl transferase [Lyophyllum shimeji]